MHWTLFALAGLALFGAHILRLPSKSGFLTAFAAFSAGLAGAALLIKCLAGANGIGRATQFDGVVNQALILAEQTDAPLIVFSGASFSRNAIDDERLTLALKERGANVRILNLSLEAASLPERRAHLRDFLNRTPRQPKIIFLEVARRTDERPTFIFSNSKFSARAIEQFGMDETTWAAMGLAGGACEGAGDCTKESLFLGIHSLMNALNIGLISKGERTANTPPIRSYEGLNLARETIDAQMRSAQLSQPIKVQPRSALKWAHDFRSVERQDYLNAGAGRIAYYFPPVISADDRAYVSGLCAGELAANVCIAPDAPELLLRLDSDVWLDTEHLLDSGAAIYTDWLADQIIASAILDLPASESVGVSDK